MSRLFCFLLVSLLVVPPLAAAEQQSAQAGNGKGASSAAGKPSKDAKAAPKSGASQESGGSGAEKALQESKKEKEEKQPLSSVKQAATGLLTGKFGIQLLEDYTHLSSNQLFINGFGVLPVLVVGNVSVQKVRRDLLTTTLNFSYKYNNDLQFAFRFPFQYTYTRLSTPNGITGNSAINANSDRVTTSFDIGDLSAGVTYHLIEQTLTIPDVYLGMNLKSRTGRDSFQTKDPQAHPPSGSGYNSILVLASFDKVSAPGLLFGSISYAYGFPRKNVVFCTSTGQCALLDYSPGPSIGLSGGLAISLNYELSLNFGYQQTLTLPGRINGNQLPNSSSNVIMMSIGGTWQYSAKHSFSLTFYQGVTSDSPDFRLGIRIPWQF